MPRNSTSKNPSCRNGSTDARRCWYRCWYIYSEWCPPVHQAGTWGKEWQHSHCLEYQAAVKKEWNRPACTDAKAAQSTVKGSSKPQNNRHPVVLLLLRKLYLDLCTGASLVVQWLSIRLAMQGTWVQSLAGELRSHMPWSNQPTCCNRCAHAFRSRLPRLESPCATMEDPACRN